MIIHQSVTCAFEGLHIMLCVSLKLQPPIFNVMDTIVWRSLGEVNICVDPLEHPVCRLVGVDDVLLQFIKRDCIHSAPLRMKVRFAVKLHWYRV